jgi:hypothetical protein
MQTFGKLMLAMALLAAALGLARTLAAWVNVAGQDGPQGIKEAVASLEQDLKDHEATTSADLERLSKSLDNTDMRLRRVEDAIIRIEEQRKATTEVAIGIFVALFALVVERAADRFARRPKKGNPDKGSPAGA